MVDKKEQHWDNLSVHDLDAQREQTMDEYWDTQRDIQMADPKAD